MNDGRRNDYRWRTTKGTGDFIFSEAEKRRRFARKCAEIFKSWGYSEVITPTLAYYQSLAPGLGSNLEENLFKFFEQDGKLLALRPEMTTPVARVVGTRLRDHPLPLRCYYIADVYRNEKPQASHRRQFLQAGIELIGTRDRLADVEVILVVLETLKALGLKDFRLDIGHIGFLKGLLSNCGLKEEEERGIRNALREKNLVDLQVIIDSLEECGEPASLLREVPFFNGSVEMLERVAGMTDSETAHRALEKLKTMAAILTDQGHASSVRFDLSMVKDFDYYTGIIFEAYTDDLGFSLCTGGRYDNLLRHFGPHLPAVGFAMGLERIFWALEKNGDPVEPDRNRRIWVYYKPAAEAQVLSFCRGLRERGWIPAIMGRGVPTPEESHPAPVCTVKLDAESGRETVRMLDADACLGAAPGPENEGLGPEEFLSWLEGSS